MYFDNRTKSVDFQGHGLKVKVTRPYFRIHHEIGQESLWTWYLIWTAALSDSALWNFTRTCT